MHATPRKKDPKYDHGKELSTIAVTLHRDDGTRTDIDLVLTPSQVETHHVQLAQLSDRRQKFGSGFLVWP